MGQRTAVPVRRLLSAIAAALVVLHLGACGSCSDEPKDKSGAESPQSEAKSGGGEKIDPEAPRGEPAGPAPRVRVVGELEGRDDVQLVVESRGEELAKLAPAVAVERHTGDGWTQAATMTLRWSCDREPAEKCVELVPGAELRPPPWLAKQGAAQCECDDCEPAPAGRYRFVLESCGGGHRLEGEPFELGR